VQIEIETFVSLMELAPRFRSSTKHGLHSCSSLVMNFLPYVSYKIITAYRTAQVISLELHDFHGVSGLNNSAPQR